MGRPVFPYELTDPDFSWLINNYQEAHPENTSFECGCLPVVFLVEPESERDYFILPHEMEEKMAMGKKE